MAKTAVIVIEDEKNDDWMKSLPGYQDEVKIHESLKFDKPGDEGAKGGGRKPIIVQVES
jgi:hypothetical protein